MAHNNVDFTDTPQTAQFWESLDHLISTSQVVLDRPAGSRHPKYPQVVYPLDYGYLEGTTSMDGGGIDLWVGTLSHRRLTGIICTIDMHKRDSEIKLLLGCSAADVDTILRFLNSGFMRAIYIERGSED